MSTLAEALNSGSPTQLHDALMAGIADISAAGTVSFTVYTKTVLPLDGFVFWLRSSSFEVAGSLHWMGEREQNEDETTGRYGVVFTTGTRVTPFNSINTQQIIVGNVDGRSFAFDKQGWFYEPAGIWHYTGDALHPAVSTQLIDNPAQLDRKQLIVSNSIPAWLALYDYRPIWLAPLNPGIPLYPSYLVPENLEPPFGAVHIEPGGISALQPVPHYDRMSSHYQLTSERVRVTLYGCNNDMAADFMDLVFRYSLDTDAIGIMGAGPVIRDEKRPWPAAMVLAQKKTLEFEVSYYQTRINDIARQMVLDAQASVFTPCTIAPKICIEGAAFVTCDATVARSGFGMNGVATVTVSATARLGMQAAIGGVAGLAVNATQTSPAPSAALQLEDATGSWALEDGSGVWLWNAAVPPAQVNVAGAGNVTVSATLVSGSVSALGLEDASGHWLAENGSDIWLWG